MNKFTSDFEINDYSINIRNILTKGQVHEEIASAINASNGSVTISTRGRYVPPDLKNPLNRDRPLYLFIQANSQMALNMTIRAIVNRIDLEESKFSKLTNKNNFQKNMAHLQNTVAKLPVILDAPPAFDLRNRVVGVDGTNLNYIQTETGALSVSLRGKGSLFVDPTTQSESNEPLHLYIEHTNPESLQEAKQLAKNLIETIQQDLTLFKSQNSQNKPNNPSQQQNPTGIMQNNNQQITIPTFPPPSLIQPNFIQQAPPTIIQQPQNATNAIIQQPTTTFHSVPMQIIQQTPITIPPPTIPTTIRTQPIVQLQPANFQIQSSNGQQAQILVNQSPQQFQLQYCNIQPNQPIQGIIQTTPIQQQMPTANQQIITLQSLQGNAFMIPPPSIIQTAGEINLNATENKDKDNDAVNRSDKPDANNIQVSTTRAILATPMTFTNISPLMTVPPPNIQQIQSAQSQIFNQIPVSIQQQPPQIHQVAGGHHFILQNQPWQQNPPQGQQTQQITQLNQIQQIRNANEIQQQHQIIQTINPQMQIQFHSTNPPQFEPQPQIQVSQVSTPSLQSPTQNQNFQQQGSYVMYNKQPNELQRLAQKRKHPSDSDEDNKNQNQPNKTGIGGSSNPFGNGNNQMMAVNNVGTVGVANNNTGGGVNNNNNNNRQPMPFNPSKNPKNNPMRINVNNDSKNNNNFNKFNRNNNKNNESQQRNVAAPIGGSIGNNMMGNVKNDKPPLPGEQMGDIRNLQMNQRQENFEEPKTRMMNQQRPPGVGQPGNGNPNFRFGSPSNFGQHQNPPPNVSLPQQNFNQNRNMNSPGGFQQPPPQSMGGNQFMPHARPMMQEMNFTGNNHFNPRFGPPPAPPNNSNVMMGNSNARNFPNQQNHAPRFRQW